MAAATRNDGRFEARRAGRGYRAALEALASTESGLPDVVSHEVRVARTATEIAAEVGMAPDDVNALRLATRFHDVGKTRVPVNVLRKPGRPSEDEWELIKRHALDGARMLSAIPDVPRVMVDVARYHHERYDGFGYEGLVGEDIPFAARVVAIADVHDALRAERDYKAAMSEAEALVMMSSDRPAGAFGRRAFDPVLLRKFVAMRLRDPAMEASSDVRHALAEFAGSDPSLDLAPERRTDVEFDPDGGRRIMAGPAGGRYAVAHVDAGGATGEPDIGRDRGPSR